MATAHRTLCRMTLLLGDDDTWRHRPLYREIIRRAKQAGLAWAMVLHGIEGYGRSADRPPG